MNRCMPVELSAQVYLEGEVTFLNKIIMDKSLPDWLRIKAATSLNETIEIGCTLSKKTGYSFLPYAAHDEPALNRVEA